MPAEFLNRRSRVRVPSPAPFPISTGESPSGNPLRAQMQEMPPAPNTALFTASAPIPDGFAKAIPSAPEAIPSCPEAKPSAPKSRRHLGIWQEHGKWSTSAGKDPVTGLRLRQNGFDSAEAAQAWRDRQRGMRAGRRVNRSTTAQTAVLRISPTPIPSSAKSSLRGSTMIGSKSGFSGSCLLYTSPSPRD